MNGTDINHNCLECNENYSLLKYFNNSMNCYKNCDYYYYFENELNIKCTNDDKCPDEYPYLISYSRECIKNDFGVNISNLTHSNQEQDNIYSDLTEIRSIIQDILNQNNKTAENESKEKDDEINKYNLIIKKMESIILTGSFNISKIDNGNDEIINAEKMIITISSIDNQKINKNKNITSIDFGQCESILINNYSKSNDKDLYIKIVQVSQEGMKIPKIEYEVYNKISPTNFQKLNLTEICGDKKIYLSIPMELTESLDKLNSSSGYYNDICYTTTSDSGTDITLKDRKKEYIDKNKTVCQDDCDFSQYNYTTQKVTCSCNVKDSSLTFTNIYIDKSKLLKNFIDIKNIANLNFLICYQNLLCKSGLIKNIGSYIILVIILFHIICIFIFYIQQLNLLKNKIKEIIFGIKNFIIVNTFTKGKKSLTNKKYINNFFNYNQKEIINGKSNCRINETSNAKSIKGIKLSKNITKNKIRFKNHKNKIRKNNIFSFLNINNTGNENDFRKISKSNTNKLKIIRQVQKIMKYNEDELNDLPYNLAIQYDKRTYCKYYIYLLKLNHDLLFSFCETRDYNSKIIKIDLFFIGFSMFYTINALFYDDDTMHNLYENDGTFDFIYQFPKDFYSSLISMLLNTILKVLALSNDEIINFKKSKFRKNIKKVGNILMTKLKVKFIFYFIISFIFLFMFWYYISMFGAIYKNTQYHLIKDTFISYGLSLIYPFIFSLLPGMFRIPALSNIKKNRKCLYNFSKILQIL